MTELGLSPAVAERLAGAAGLDRWYKVAERLRDESASEEERLVLRWHVVAFDYQLVMPERRPEGGRGPALLPKATFEGGGSYPDPVAQIPEEAVSQWLAAADLVEDPLLRARYRDLLWHRRIGRAGDHARAAAEAYLEIAQNRERFEGFMVITATSRAIELAQVVDARELLAGAVAAGVAACSAEMAAEDPKPGVVIRMLAVLDWLPPAHRPAELGEYLARMAHLRGELELVGARPARDLPARRATEWLDALAETWQKTELVEEKSDVIHAVYERIVIEGPRFVGLQLTPAAYRHGLALALPEAAMARPTGVGRALATYAIPIQGRDEWLAAARVRSA